MEFDLNDNKENIFTEFRASTDNLDPASTQEAQFFTTSRVKQSSVNGDITGSSELDRYRTEYNIPGLIGISTGVNKTGSGNITNTLRGIFVSARDLMVIQEVSRIFLVLEGT